MKTSKTQILSTAPQYARIALEVEEELDAKIKTGEKLVCDGVVIPTHFSNTPLVGELTSLAEFIGGCGCGRFYVSIEPNGDIYPCVFFPHKKEVKLGNIIKEDFDEIWWKSDLLKKTRDKDLLENECKKCRHRYICGGCRARAYNYFGSLRAPDPGCIRNKASWNRIEQELKTKIH
jgi:radical SAM protein with 4Fe4S-binding SPASM domain